MKQRRFGKKIQNWHRPLAHNELSQRFRRLRYEHPEIKRRGSSVVEVADVPLDLQVRDQFCPCDDSAYYEHLAELHWQHNYTFFSLLNDLAGSTSLFPGRSSSWSSRPPTDAIELERRVSKHFKQLCVDHDLASLKQDIHDSLDLEDLQALSSYTEMRDNKGYLVKLCLFAPFWIRSPKTWDSTKSDLLSHLFVEFDVPPSIFASWDSGEDKWSWRLLGDETNYKWFYWFILFAQGGSLRRVSERLGWDKQPRKFEHFLRNSPADVAGESACVYAFVRCMGGTENDFRRLACYFGIHEYLQVPAAFQRSTVRWVIDQATGMDDEQFDEVISWLLHKLTENRQFSIAKLSLSRVLRESRQYRIDLETDMWSDPSANPWKWDNHELDFRTTGDDGDSWDFKELTSSEELYQEGKQLSHCVAGYAQRCVMGDCAIVSLERNGQKTLTLEVVPSTWRILQARGEINRPANARELKVISIWIKHLSDQNIPNTDFNFF